jgi:hypothetical protein
LRRDSFWAASLQCTGGQGESMWILWVDEQSSMRNRSSQSANQLTRAESYETHLWSLNGHIIGEPFMRNNMYVCVCKSYLKEGSNRSVLAKVTKSPIGSAFLVTMVWTRVHAQSKNKVSHKTDTSYVLRRSHWRPLFPERSQLGHNVASNDIHMTCTWHAHGTRVKCFYGRVSTYLRFHVQSIWRGDQWEPLSNHCCQQPIGTP